MIPSKRITVNHDTNEGRRLKDDLDKLRNRDPLQEWRLKHLKDSPVKTCSVCGKHISGKGICFCNDVFTED